MTSATWKAGSMRPWTVAMCTDIGTCYSPGKVIALEPDESCRQAARGSLHLASSSKRMSRSQFMVRVWIWKIWVRDSRSGRPNSTLRSRRPGRSNAGSNVSGRFVAMSTCMREGHVTSCELRCGCLSIDCETLEAALMQPKTNKLMGRCISDSIISPSRLKSPKLLYDLQGIDGHPSSNHSQLHKVGIESEGSIAQPLQSSTILAGASWANLDIAPAIKTVQLVHDLQHGALDLIVPACATTKSASRQRIRFPSTKGLHDRKAGPQSKTA